MHLAVVSIWCDGSIRRAKIPNIMKHLRVAFAAWHADTGQCWYDMVYAKTSSEAELSAIMMGLFWASQQGFHNIILHTDAQSIPENLYGRKQGKNLGDLPALINACTEVKIVHIPRCQNNKAHQLCDAAYKEYLRNPIPPRKMKGKWSTHSLDTLQKAHSEGYINSVKPI